jgi:hypothetical protein
MAEALRESVGAASFKVPESLADILAALETTGPNKNTKFGREVAIRDKQETGPKESDEVRREHLTPLSAASTGPWRSLLTVCVVCVCVCRSWRSVARRRSRNSTHFSLAARPKSRSTRRPSPPSSPTFARCLLHGL